MSRAMHPHSLAAYHDGKTERFSRRAQEILAAIHELQTASDRHVCQRLGFSDMNAVRPRITELIRQGVLEECGETHDTVTDRMVRVVRVVPPRPSWTETQLEMEVAS